VRTALTVRAFVLSLVLAHLLDLVTSANDNGAGSRAFRRGGRSATSTSMSKRSKKARKKPAQPWKNPIPRLTIGEQRVPQLTVGDRRVPVYVNDTGLPKVSGRLMELARPLINRLPKGASEEAVAAIVEIATVAWNLSMLEQPDAISSARLREQTRRVVDLVAVMPDGEREVFDGMVETRRTTFADDPRVIVSTTLKVRDGMIHLDAASLHFKFAEVGP